MQNLTSFVASVPLCDAWHLLRALCGKTPSARPPPAAFMAFLTADDADEWSKARVRLLQRFFNRR